MGGGGRKKKERGEREVEFDDEVGDFVDTVIRKLRCALSYGRLPRYPSCYMYVDCMNELRPIEYITNCSLKLMLF